MVKIFPEALPNSMRNEVKRHAEIRLYDLLCEQLRGNWSVFYNVAWLGLTSIDGVPRDGETDFIIAHPDHGILLIEVKGGAISYSGSRWQWISTDRWGAEHNIDPFGQAVRCKHALLEKIKSLPHWSNRWVNLGHAVAFPHGSIEHVPLPPEASASIIIDARDLSRLPDRLIEIMRYWRGQEPQPTYNGVALIVDLEKILAPTITLRNPLSLQMREEEKEILKLTARQFSVLNTLRHVRRAAISGCAGAGKTMLAVEKARRLASEGFRTLLTCYNKHLASYLLEVAGQHERLTVCTFHKLCKDIAQMAGVDLPDTTTVNKFELSRIFNEDYPSALCQAIALHPDGKYDAIVVDEGQDFADTWWIALEDCLKENQQSIFYVFYDDNQRVYRDRGLIPADLLHIPLEENVRNTRTIHQTLVTYYQGEVPSLAHGPVGRSIEKYPCRGDADLKKLLQSALHKLIHVERIVPHDIVLLTPKERKRSLLNDLTITGNIQFTWEQNKNRDAVLCSTIHSFKGLERPVAVVVELEREILANQYSRDDLCYVAFSRPRNHLILLAGADVIQMVLPGVTT